MRPSGTDFNEIWIRILSFSFMKMHMKMSSARMAAILSRGRWVNIQHTLTSWIIVYIRIFILRKFSDLYGLIWVYTLIWNSPFHPIRILFKSIRFLYIGKVNNLCEIPAENVVHEFNCRQISPHDYAGNWPSFCWKHTYLSLRWPLHMVNQIFHQYLWRYLQQKVAYSVNTWHENIMATRLASMLRRPLTFTLPYNC